MRAKLCVILICLSSVLLSGCQTSRKIETASIIENVSISAEDSRVCYTFYILSSDDKPKGIRIPADSFGEARKLAESEYIPNLSLSKLELLMIEDSVLEYTLKNDIEYKSLSATLIVVIHSPYGLLVAHVGDGRAGYRDKEGVWHSMITPHKGEEANQTVFLTSGFWDSPSFILSGVTVPETRVIRQPVTAFTLMSDGCENTAWLFNQRDENTGHYYDPNKPFPKFFDPLIVSLDNERRDGASEEDIESNWSSFIEEGTRGFVAESDDKTMILGFTRE